MMSYATRKGYEGEVEAADFLQGIYRDDLIVRFGGQEFAKFSHDGDVGLIRRKHKGSKVLEAKRDMTESPLYDVFIEVKKQARPNIWKDFSKALDDADNVGKRDVVLYAIRQERGEKGERLICMRPETFRKLVTRGT